MNYRKIHYLAHSFFALDLINHSMVVVIKQYNTALLIAKMLIQGRWVSFKFLANANLLST